MNSTFAIRLNVKGFVPVALAFVAGMANVAYAQTITAVSGSGSAQTNLVPHAAVFAFVPSQAGSAQEALQSAATSAAEGKVLVAVASRTLPIPVIGALPVEGALRVFGKLHKPTVKGFDVGYLQGLSSETTIPGGETRFTVPAEALQGSSPLLLRIKPSSKDNARVVRSFQVTLKMTGSQLNPATREVLGVDQDAVPCHTESGPSGGMVLTPNSPLASGEYAIVLAPNQHATADAPAGLIWDFRVR